MAIDLTETNPDVVAVSKRASEAKWEVKWRKQQSSNAYSLSMHIPNGRVSRRRPVGPLRARLLLSGPFEASRALGDYLAIDNNSQNYFEAQIRSVDAGDLTGIRQVARVINAGSSRSTRRSRELTDDATEGRHEVNGSWSIKLADKNRNWSVEISAMSDQFIALMGAFEMLKSPPEDRPATIKLHGVSVSRYDDAVRRLESICGAVFFDFDLLYGIALELDRVDKSDFAETDRRSNAKSSPTLPKLRYPEEVLRLYSYGRSAVDLPLLQFLAYYQVLEFFFPAYFQRDLLRTIRHAVTDPRFDPTDDGSLIRVLNIASGGSKPGYGRERDQLLATIQGSVDERAFEEFLHEDPDLLRRLGDKALIKGVPTINESNRDSPLSTQVAVRLYALRCRIVHTKSDDLSSELLLPGSPEADSLWDDLSVLKFLAQKAIIASGVPLT